MRVVIEAGMAGLNVTTQANTITLEDRETTQGKGIIDLIQYVKNHRNNAGR